MRRLSDFIVLAALCAVIVACGNDTELSPSPTASSTAIAAPTADEATATPAASATPELVRQDIRATRLTIPSLGIDAEVEPSQTVPYVDVPPPGCPPRNTEETETVTVPNQGIATPEDSLEGLENKAWIYGHSRWLGAAGTFLTLQDLELGDELFVDGVDRASGEAISGRRFVVNGLYLADTDSGERILNAEGAQDIPPEPIVILQTSVREDGAGKQWILDQQTLLDKAVNTVEGNLDDPCKYLLLFVTASPEP